MIKHVLSIHKTLDPPHPRLHKHKHLSRLTPLWQLGSRKPGDNCLRRSEKVEPSARRKPRSSMKCDLVSKLRRTRPLYQMPLKVDIQVRLKSGSPSEICSGSSWCSVLSAQLSPVLFHPGEGWRIGRVFSRRVEKGILGVRMPDSVKVFWSSKAA